MVKKLIPLLLILLCGHIQAQESRRIVVRQVHELQNGKNLDSVEVNIAIPKDYDHRQTINDISYSVNPKLIFKKDNISYAHFALDRRKLKNLDSIVIEIDMTLYHYDLGQAKKRKEPEKLSKRKRKKYLEISKLYQLSANEKEPLLQELEQLEGLEYVQQSHDFVVDHISYRSFFGKDLGADYALSKGEGDCTEYSDLMISLCRSRGYPARRVAGCTVSQENNDLLSQIFKYTTHAWVEVYFDDLGWVPFDPTHSDGSRVTNFNHLQTKYVYYSYDEESKRVDSWRWWGNAQFKVKSRTLVRDLKAEES